MAGSIKVIKINEKTDKGWIPAQLRFFDSNAINAINSKISIKKFSRPELEHRGFPYICICVHCKLKQYKTLTVDVQRGKFNLWCPNHGWCQHNCEQVEFE